VRLEFGPLRIKAPRAHDRRCDQRFTSRTLLPCLRGLSTGDFSEALAVLLRPEAAGFSTTAISRLLQVWQDEYQVWRKRSLEGKDYLYMWADGVYFNIRFGEDRPACLAIVGVLPNGRKEVIALEDGYRESTELWASVLRDLKRPGMLPQYWLLEMAIWASGLPCGVYPEMQEQRCWKHKIGNVLVKLPKRLQPRAKVMLHEIMKALNRESALEKIGHFSKEYGARYPKAVETLNKDQNQLLTYFGFPAKHWIRLGTTNPIEAPFATVKARTKKTKGAGSRKAGLAMAFKLLLSAEKRWCRVNAPHLVALVRAVVDSPNRQVEMPQVNTSENCLFAETLSIHIASEVCFTIFGNISFTFDNVIESWHLAVREQCRSQRTLMP